MKPSYEFLRLAVLVIAFLLPMVVGRGDTMSSAADGPANNSKRTFMRSSSSSSSSGRLICTSPHLRSSNEITSFGVLNAAQTGHNRRRSRKSRLLQARLSAAAAAASAESNEVGGHQPREEEAFWLRNKCHDGFVVVKEKTRVLAQHEGLDKFNPDIKLVKESCVAGDPKTSSLMTRLYSPSQERYICFNRKGKVRAVKPKRAERMGRQCAFYERTVPDSVMASSGGYDDGVSTYINLQSAHRPDWYLGFGPSNRPSRRLRSLGLVHTRDGHRAALPRRMPMFHHVAAARSGQHKRKRLRRSEVRAQVEKRCDFSFATARFVSPDPEEEWSGLFSALPESFELPSVRTTAALQSEEEGGRDQGNTKTATSKTTTTTKETTNQTLPPSSTTKATSRNSMTPIKNTHPISTPSTTTTAQSESKVPSPKVLAAKMSKNRNIELLIAEKMRQNPRFALALRKRALLKLKMKRLRRARIAGKAGTSFFYLHDQQVKVSRKNKKAL